MSTPSDIPLVGLELRFHPREQFFPCSNEYYELSKSYVYYNYDDIYAYNGKKYYSITYFIYYKTNGAIGFNSMFTYNKSLGYHDKDLENIKILYNMTTRKPEYVFFSAHQQEGRYFNFSDCRFTDDGFLIVYVSLNSHSCRRLPGTYWRIFGIANDYASDLGMRVRPDYLKTTEKYKTQNREVFDANWKSFFLPLIQSSVGTRKEEQKKDEEARNATAIPS